MSGCQYCWGRGCCRCIPPPEPVDFRALAKRLAERVLARCPTHFGIDDMTPHTIDKGSVGFAEFRSVPCALSDEDIAALAEAKKAGLL